MSIATELQNYADGLDDSYDAVDDMGGIIPQHKNMNNLDQAIRTIPQGSSYTAGSGIDITGSTISVDNTAVPFFSDLASVATSGNYSDLNGTPSLAAVATSGDYTDLINTPTIPTVNDATLTITQNGTSAGTFTANASSNTTIALTDTTYSNFGGATSSVAGSAGLVPAPTTSDPDKFLKGDGTWGTPPVTSYTAGNGINIDANNEISVDTTVVATQSDLSGKQDTLTAGTNITINGSTISATDTTYSAFTGATSGSAGTSGLVPAPAAGDEGKVLQGDGTWATIASIATISSADWSALWQ